MTSTLFGQLPDGRDVHQFVLGGPGGPQLRLLDQGASVHGFRLRDDDPSSEVMVGFADLERQQQAIGAHFGAVVGRYANRIAGGSFELDGTHHQVTQNEGSTALHGGIDGFTFRIWEVLCQDETSITFELVSPDGDQGFPGKLTARATYRLMAGGFSLELWAISDAPTPCCLTSHAYLNLAGGGSADDHLIQVEADHYVPINNHSIPLGHLAPVAGTPFDLRNATRVGDAVRVEHEQVALAKGIDHSFDIRGEGLRTVARVECPATRRRLELLSDQPALQVYTGNFLDGEWVASNGQRLRQGDALALEPHQHPDSPNQPWGADAVLRPGQEWTSAIEWHFTER